jgi:hypothetical protein
MIRDEAVNWDEDDEEDQSTRSEASSDRVNTENANWEFSETHLYGSAFQCIKCNNSLTCTSCIAFARMAPALRCIGA